MGRMTFIAADLELIQINPSGLFPKIVVALSIVAL